MKHRRVALVVAVVFTAVAGVAFCVSVAAIATSIYYRPTIESTGSGGIGAVPFGLAEGLVEMLPVIIAAVYVNLSVAAQARQRGRTAVWIRRAHLVLIALTPFWPIVIIPLVALGPGILENLANIMFGVGAAMSGAHATFGVFAIKLLRIR
jgi:hypothetical protein